MYLIKLKKKKTVYTLLGNFVNKLFGPFDLRNSHNKFCLKEFASPHEMEDVQAGHFYSKSWMADGAKLL